ncbi:MAG: MarR family transcriptional regulator [Pseudomonadota bacterium]
MSDLRIFHAMQRAHAALFRAADRRFRAVEGITASQLAVLFSLAGEDGVPISAIAGQLKMGKSSLTGLIDRMTILDLVRREKNDADARSQLVFIQPRGRRILDRSTRETRAINEALLAPFNADERALIAHFLDHIATNADGIVEDTEPEAETEPEGIS